MEPLSVVASITGILTAAAKVSSLLMQIQGAPAAISSIQTEIDHIKIVFTGFQNFVNYTAWISGSRAALIQLDDVLVILTQTVLDLSELQTMITPLSSRGKLSVWQRLNWPRHEAAFLRLINQLQRHKTSLSLLLQIIQW